MFSPRKRPLLLVADRLLALRLSLNTPVVATPDLPAGPARAAIAVHTESGRPCFTVAVRSLRQGIAVLYELEGEDPNDASGLAVALDAALSFGESMGFLFDDEQVTSRDEPVLRAALAKLREIVAPPSPDVGETTSELEVRAEEILLEEALGELDSGLAGVAALAPEPTPPAAHAAPPTPPAPANASARLTKFRMVAAASDEPRAGGPPAATPPPADAGETSGPASTGRSATTTRGVLGRVKPVRRRAPDAPAPVPVWLRLLSSF